MRIIIFLGLLISAVLAAPPTNQLSSRQDDSLSKLLFRLEMGFSNNDKSQREEWLNHFQLFLNQFKGYQFKGDNEADDQINVQEIEVATLPGQTNSNQYESRQTFNLHIAFKQDASLEQRTNWIRRFQPLLDQFLKEYKVDGQIFVKLPSTMVVPLSQGSSQLNQGQASTAADQDTVSSIQKIHTFFYSCTKYQQFNMRKELLGENPSVEFNGETVEKPDPNGNWGKYSLKVNFKDAGSEVKARVINKIRNNKDKRMNHLACVPPIPGLCAAPNTLGRRA